jgi:hypothetical protein
VQPRVVPLQAPHRGFAATLGAARQRTNDSREINGVDPGGRHDSSVTHRGEFAFPGRSSGEHRATRRRTGRAISAAGQRTSAKQVDAGQPRGMPPGVLSASRRGMQNAPSQYDTVWCQSGVEEAMDLRLKGDLPRSEDITVRFARAHPLTANR